MLQITFYKELRHSFRLKINKIKYLLFNYNSIDFSANDTRDRNILISGIASLFSRFIQIIVAIITVPLTLNYLGVERYGMLVTFTSLVGLISFADLGLSIGLQNSIPKSTKTEELRVIISSTFFTLLVIASILVVIFSYLYFLTDWEKIVNVQSTIAKSESKYSILVIMSFFVIGLPFSMIQKINAGMQKSYINSFWQVYASIASIVSLLTIIHLKFGTPSIIFAVYGINVLFTIINWGYFFLFKEKSLLPKFHYFSLKSFKELFYFGGIFFALQVFTLLGNSSDSIILAQYLGPSSVAIYAIGFKLYQTLIIPVQVFLEPTWPALNEALHKNDYKWVKATIKSNFIFSLLTSVVLSIILIFFGEYIVKLWIGNSIILPTEVIYSFVLLIFNSNIGGAFCSILNTEKFLRPQLFLIIGANSSSILLKLILVNNFGIVGVIISTVLSFSLFYYIPAYYLIQKKMEK